MHIQVSQQILAWERRAPQIIEEIAESKADLICLQEVNRYGKSSCARVFFRPEGLALLQHLLTPALLALGVCKSLGGKALIAAL